MRRGTRGRTPGQPRPRLAGLLAALSIAIAAMVAWLPGAFSAPHVAGGPFACTDDLLYSYATGSGATQVGRLVMAKPGAVLVSPIGTPIDARLNGLGFNPGDDYLYASADLIPGGYPGTVDPGGLYRISSTGDAVNLGPFLGFPQAHGLAFTGGTFVAPDQYLVSLVANPSAIEAESTPILAVIDVTTRLVVRQATVANTYQDLAFDPLNGSVYGYESGGGRLDVIDPASLHAKPSRTPHAAGLKLGASWFLSTGQLLEYGTARDVPPHTAAVLGSTPPVAAASPSQPAPTTTRATTTAPVTPPSTTTTTGATTTTADPARAVASAPVATSPPPAVASSPSPEVVVAPSRSGRARRVPAGRVAQPAMPRQYGTTTMVGSTTTAPATTIPLGTTTTGVPTTTFPTTTSPTTTTPVSVSVTTTSTTIPEPPPGGFELYAAVTDGSDEAQGALAEQAFGPEAASIDGASCPTAAVVSPPPSGSTTSLPVSPVANRPPIAVDDAYTTPRGKALRVSAPGLLVNDSDPDGDAIHPREVSGPRHGRLTVAADGSFTYTPAGAFVGRDSFRYRVSDGSLDSADATVTIDVLPGSATTTTTTAPVAGHGTSTTTPAAVVHPPAAPPPTVTISIPHGTPPSGPTSVPVGSASSVPAVTATPPVTPTTSALPVPPVSTSTPVSTPTTIGSSARDLSIELSSSVVVPSGDDSVTVRGCAPGSEAELSLDSTSIGHATAGPDGMFSVPFVAPGSIGPHALRVRCGSLSQVLSFDVVASTASEAPDGSAALLLALFVLLIVALSMGRGRLPRASRGDGSTDG